MVATPFGQRQEQETAVGSGFVLDGRGDIVTAAHVVDGASSIRVAFQNGAAREATILGTDDASDVALVQVNPAGLTLDPLALGSSRALAVGDALAVIGDPLGFERSLSTGVVSGLDRTIQAPNGFEIAHAIQTDAAMNPGASGGPLFASDGRVIGIADQVATGTNQFGRSTTETNTGVGFAVPIDLIKTELAPLEHGWHISHAYLGIATVQGTDSQHGALVGTVQSGAPAAKAGLRAGDLIVAFDGITIASSGELDRRARRGPSRTAGQAHRPARHQPHHLYRRARIPARQGALRIVVMVRLTSTRPGSAGRRSYVSCCI